MIGKYEKSRSRSVAIVVRPIVCEMENEIKNFKKNNERVKV